MCQVLTVHWWTQLGDTSAAHALAESFLDVTPDVTPRGADGETHEAALHSLRNVSGGNNPGLQTLNPET